MRNCPDGFVAAEARNETAVDDLGDASFMLKGLAISDYSAYPT
jgi:hypothetical protein